MEYNCMVKVILLAYNVYNLGISNACELQLTTTAADKIDGNKVDIACQILNCDRDGYFLIIWSRKDGTDYNEQLVYDHRTGLSTPSSGGQINGRASGEFQVVLHILTINPIKVEDSGIWLCEYESFTTRLSSPEAMIDILVIPTRGDINVDGPTQALVTEEVYYTCTVDRVKPEFLVQWSKNRTDISGDTTTSAQNPDGLTWSFTSALAVSFIEVGIYELRCSIRTADSKYQKYDEKSSKIKAPAKIESIVGTEGDINITDTLSLTCEVTGSDVNITWWRDDTRLVEDYKITEGDKDGSYDYGQIKARLSTLTWKSPDSSASCDTVTNFTGNYRCQASAFGNTQAQSQQKTITVLYAPILVTPGHEEIAAMINETVTMTCIVKCASPRGETYIWTSENNRDGIDENAAIIEITVTEDDFQDTFTCTVENSIGAVSKRLSISKKETTIAMTTTTELLHTSSGPAESSANKSGLDFGARLGIGFTVGIVFCGIIVSSFIIYHRTECYKKQKTSLHQNAYENEDITLDDHADVTPYEQVNDIDYEPDHPTNYVNVKPTSYVNVKSTSFANIDPTSYVNVNAMEPSKYEQLKQRNSRNIEISTYEDLNGKAK